MLRDRSLVPLSHQHHNALALCVLTERSLGEDSGEANVHRLALRILDRFEIELTNHFTLEEELLFPALREAGIEEPVVRLIGEHRQLEEMVGSIRRAPTSALLTEFTALLRRHVRSEENELFEEAQRHLPRETLDALGQELDARVVRVCL